MVIWILVVPAKPWKTEMNNYLCLLLPLILTGAVSGLSAGLFGVGGGFVIVPMLFWLLESSGVHPDFAMTTAVATSLACIIVTSARACLAHNKNQAVDWDLLRAWGPGLCVGACVGAWFATDIEASQLKRIFACFVLIMSIKFFFPVWLSSKRWFESPPMGVLGAMVASFIGGISSLLGIGGGTLAVVIMRLAGHSLHKAIGTASGIGFAIALPATLMFGVLNTHHNAMLPGNIGQVNILGFVIISTLSFVVAGFAAGLAHRLNGKVLSYLFGTYLVIIGTAMLS